MALAESMKNLVNDLKASRRSRHEFVKGNREITKNMMAENRKFLQDIHAQNKARAEQTHAFLKSSKETRMQDYKQVMDRIHGDISRIRQAKEAITQGAREMIKEFRADAQMAHKYWASLATDEPIKESAEELSEKSIEDKKKEKRAKKMKEKQDDAKAQKDPRAPKMAGEKVKIEKEDGDETEKEEKVGLEE